MRIRAMAGALLYDALPFELRLRGAWQHIRNRDERVTIDGRGVQCEWRWGSDLHYPKVFASAGRRLQKAALREFPIELAESRRVADPVVTFVIGHRGSERLPLLLTTLKTIAAQRFVDVECVVVEQAEQREAALPEWVRAVHQPMSGPYNRGAAFNEGVRHARGRVVVLHDNDMLAPSRYAAELAAHADAGFEFMDLKRFIFYLGPDGRNIETIVQNVHGGSIAATRDAYEAIGGFDESFVGWGGEDNEFWERAETRRATRFGYLPFLHLHHGAQAEKLLGNEAPASRRYHELAAIAPVERIARLRGEGRGARDEG